MQAYIIRRRIAMAVTTLICSIIIFTVTRVMPGNLIDLILTEGDYGQIDDALRARMAAALGLDSSIPAQYIRWISNFLLHGDLGLSLRGGGPVLDEILVRLPHTIELGVLALLFALAIGLPVGIYSALHPETLRDHLGRTFSVLGLAIPGFWLGTMAVILPSIWWGWMPPIQPVPLFEEPWLNLQKFLIPALILGLAFSAIIMRMTRAMMLEVMGQDYIRTAWAKGLRERRVVMRHALRNALIPVVTLVGILVPIVFGGTVIIENIFNIPGLGDLLLTAVSGHDYTMMGGISLVITVVVITTNLLVDLSYGWLDPKVRYDD